MKKLYSSIEEISRIIPQNKTITLVGGCFDLLHIAHLHLLEYSKKLGDVLVVAVLSDRYLKTYKGSTRPVIPEEYRTALVSGLSCVDYTFTTDMSSSDNHILSTLKPHRIVFGLEDTHSAISKMQARKTRIENAFPSIEICYAERFPDITISTSAIIEKIKNS